MKYSASITQEQYIRVSPEKKIIISPEGGDFSAEDEKYIRESAYGKQLIESGILKIGVATPDFMMNAGSKTNKKAKDVPVIEQEIAE